ncbi:F-box only protein [Ooceraea biroi]|uniref:F-box only protein n=1 Tax=Ooceraea biroi TaxID=2015173 RepID=A0A026WRZ9_OOCBI|nr:F-box only protein [Ooceraea biroi]
MATITNLPVEMIYVILDFKNISVQDFANFSSTCKHLYQMLYPSSFWQRKFDQRWPALKRVRLIEMHKGYLTFEDLIEARVKCKKELRYLLAQMNEKYYHNCPDEYFQERVTRDQHRHSFFVRTLSDKYYSFHNVILDKEELTLLDDLTNIYYGGILLRHLRHYHLENVWQEFVNRPPKHQLLEEVLTFIIQWFDPETNVSYSHIGRDLDNIARTVMKRLIGKNPKHPIFSVSDEQFSSWKYNNIYENQWNNSEGRQIIDILLNILLYKRRIFDGFVHSLKSDLFRKYLYPDTYRYNLRHTDYYVSYSL